MRSMLSGLLVLGVMAGTAPATADKHSWKDGVMFQEQHFGSVEGHAVVKIIFGLEPGKCTGEITAVSEWLVMRDGTLVQTYPGKGDFERKKGDEWYQANGTKVVVCNKSKARAILEGVQFRPK